ncbi:hypothetical protein Pst134EB_003840 [Puccinia striiformis f. sp. tritici]|nr:hypothetical protein Pst134EB_003840 [Puccinia striiformis f. sp. tritici]
MASQRKPTARTSSDVFNHATPPQFIAPFSLPPLRSQHLPHRVSPLGNPAIDASSFGRLRSNDNPSSIPEPGHSPTSTKSIYETGLSARELANGLRTEPHSKSTIKILVKLRLKLSTEPLRWLEDFLLDHDGLNALENVAKESGSPHLFDKDLPYSQSPFGIEELNGPIQLELMKCLRVIMNADIGFEQVLKLEGLIRWLAFSSFTPSPSYKAKIHAAEILSAICSLSSEPGRVTVVEGFLSLTTNPEHAFQGLINSLGAERTDEVESRSETSDPLRTVEADSEDLGLVWEYRCRVLGLCNSIGTGGLYWYGLLVKADISDAIFRLSGNDPPATFVAQVEAWNANLGGPGSPRSNNKLESPVTLPETSLDWSHGSIRSLLRLINQLEPSQKSELERWSHIDDSINADPPKAFNNLLKQKSRIGSHSIKKPPPWTDVLAKKSETDNGNDEKNSHTK